MKIKLTIISIFIINLLFSQDIFRLLDLPKGYPLWNQSRNFNWHCDPSYNELAPSTNNNNCQCDHMYIGCGAVAIGQIMWFWEWPYDYDWDIIPQRLEDTTPQEESDELNRLLFDCAEEMNMNYQCAGSWATTNNVMTALHNMGYESATIHKKSDWNNNTDDWARLIRTELDAGRPVFVRGGEFLDWGDWGNIHYFICDGYDRDDPDKFHFNWGWGNYDHTVNTNSNSVFELDNLVTHGDDYSEDQQVIIGISPTCDQPAQNIYSAPFTNVYNSISAVAFNNISLPSNSSTLTVESGGELILTAGNQIILNEGFRAKQGSKFIARIRDINGCNCGGDLSVSSWTNGFTPFNNDGFNDNLCIPVVNANSYTIQTYDLDGILVFQGSGLVESNLPCVWDGSGLYNCNYILPYPGNSEYVMTNCLVIIAFYNNCGEKVDNAYLVTAIFPVENNKSGVISNQTVENKELDDHTIILKPNLYPNPTDGYINIDFNFQEISYEDVYMTITNVSGIKIFANEIADNKIDISNFKPGIYYIELIINNIKFNYKIVKI